MKIKFPFNLALIATIIAFTLTSCPGLPAVTVQGQYAKYGYDPAAGITIDIRADK